MPIELENVARRGDDAREKQTILAGIIAPLNSVAHVRYTTRKHIDAFQLKQHHGKYTTSLRAHYAYKYITVYEGTTVQGMVFLLVVYKAEPWVGRPPPHQRNPLRNPLQIYVSRGLNAWIAIAQAPPQVLFGLPVQGMLHDSSGSFFKDASGVLSKVLHQHSEPMIRCLLANAPRRFRRDNETTHRSQDRPGCIHRSGKLEYKIGKWSCHNR